jgi:hypothetical protein
MPASVKGGLELRKALRKFAPDLAKETRKEIAGILKPITARAKGYVVAPAPLSGWEKRPNSTGRFPQFDASEVKRGIGYKTTPSRPNAKGFVALAQINNKSAAGAIYETAGRNTAGGNFVPRLKPLVESPAGKGRMIYKAWEENQGKATVAVLKAIEASAAKLNERANG